MTVFLIHGSFGSPDENWFPWLRRKLERLKHTVIAPKFPVEDYNDFAKAAIDDPTMSSRKQNFINWLKTFQTYLHKVDEDTIFVAHSIGPAFVVRVLEGLTKPVKASVFVSGFYGALNLPVFDVVNRTFIKQDINWEKVRNNSEQFFCLGSDNDPYVPQLLLSQFARRLGTKLEVIEEGGHLSSKSGYVKFPRVLDIIKSIK
jgi:predicted alpha/beta hydrolase family esterase